MKPMTVSQLIRRLERIKVQVGDLPVGIGDSCEGMLYDLRGEGTKDGILVTGDEAFEPDEVTLQLRVG